MRTEVKKKKKYSVLQKSFYALLEVVFGFVENQLMRKMWDGNSVIEEADSAVFLDIPPTRENMADNNNSNTTFWPNYALQLSLFTSNQLLEMLLIGMFFFARFQNFAENWLHI